MANFKLKSPDCVLIHIHKTGGTSIRNGVWKKKYEGPVFGHIPPHWQPLFKFAFVRHPFDRLISAWKMCTEGPAGFPSWRLPEDAYPLSLEQFFDIVADERIIFDERRKTFAEKIRHHTIPQTHPFYCLEQADFVGRFERFDQDLAYIAHRLHVSEKIPKMNYTKHGDWINYMSEMLIERCYAYYRGDFERLGYSI